MAQPGDMALPAAWEAGFIRYTTVNDAARRVIRNLYVDPVSFAQARPGQALPDGTFLIVADQRARLGADGAPLRDAAGRFIPEGGWTGISARQRRPGGGGEAYPADLRNDAWVYARFDGNGRPAGGSVAACLACHGTARAQQDFTFAFWDLVQVRR